MVHNAEKLLKLGKKMTDRIPKKLGLVPMDAGDPEYWALKNLLDDEMVDICLKMKQRHPYTLQELVKITGWEENRLEEKLASMARIGLLEYHWGECNRPHTRENKLYILPIYVPGFAEVANMNPAVTDAHPEICDFFERMAFMPLEGLTPMIPPGGAGLGMHVIPVEKAIPAESQSVDLEHISYWLDKYEGHIGLGVCACRLCQTHRKMGSGDVKDYWCIGLGEFADYMGESGLGHSCTKEEAMDVLKRAEELGYCHQITNIDGERRIFAICNCAPGVCFALRTSQYFNTPNMSRSAYIAHVNKDNCVACGRCVEVCPAGAVKLGQKLCTKDGPIKYPKVDLPDEMEWGPERCNPNYRDDNRINCYPTGTSPCKTACPAHIPVQGYIQLASEGKYKEALALIKKDNPFPAVCGSICNRRCEDACTRGMIDEPVAIDEIKKFVAELELKEENRYIPPLWNFKPNYEGYDQKIAVIGAGPAGMSCAYYLANMGYKVKVYDKNPVPGGMLTLGIPNFRLEKDVVNAEIDVLKKMGVEFICNTEIGKDITIQQLRDEGVQGFYVAIGAQKSSPLRVPGEDFENVYGAVDFLRQVNLGEKPFVGKKCAVIGGGNVAMDACRTAVRLGAEEVNILYRRSEAEMPADPAEIAEAKEEGVTFRFLSAPAEILGKDGKVSGIKVEIMELGEPDEKGRRKPVGTGKFETLDVDSVIGAIGQTIDWGSLDIGKLKTDRKGRAEAEEVTYQTAQEDIFVGGDVLTGPKFAIDAIAQGREGAISLHRFVNEGQDLKLGRNRRDFIELDKDNVVLGLNSYDTCKRQVPMRDVNKAKTMFNDRLPLTEEQIKKETSRCLKCGAAEVDEHKCIGCGLCTVQCQFDAIHLSRDMPEATAMWNIDDKMKAILPYMAKRQVKIIKHKLLKK